MKLFDVYPLFDIEPVKGEGCYVYDDNGNEYLDFYGGHAVISIGHSHPHYVKALQQQLQSLAFYSNSVINSLQNELSEKLGRLSGCEAYQLFLCNSGAEANENALKLASFYNQRTKVIAFERAFHGRTSAAVNVTDNPKIQAPLNKGFEVVFHRWNDLAAVHQSLAEGDICAVIIEGVQGVGGIHVPNADFLKQVEALCAAHRTVLILDEVQSGYGRTGKFFAFQHADIQPDVITMAKGMGNGFPIGGVLIHPKFEARHGLLGTTFGGNHLACAAAIAVLDVLEQGELIENAAIIGKYLIKQLKKIKGVKEVRGMGLMIGIAFDQPVTELRKWLLFQEKVFTGSAADAYTVRLLPPLCLHRLEADLFLEKLEYVLRQQQVVC